MASCVMVDKVDLRDTLITAGAHTNEYMTGSVAFLF